VRPVVVSIIIPVRNDRRIGKTLQKLTALPSPMDKEIIVVDASNGSLDDIRRSFPSIRWVSFEDRGSRTYTFTEQINVGLQAAGGDCLAFIDADCVPADDWLMRLLAPIASGEEQYVCGAVKSATGRSFHDSSWKPVKNRYRPDAASMNTAFTRELLQRVGLFDECFAAGSDIDFSWRAVDEGYRIRYMPEAVMYHDWGGWHGEVIRGYRYGVGRALLYRKHSRRWRDLFGRHLDTLVFPVYILLLPVAIIWPWYPLALLVPILRSARREPFKKLVFDLSHGVGVLRGLACQMSFASA
jgi:GT2 family glycosyltransferase